MAEFKFNKEGTVAFSEEDHMYLNVETGEQMISVTTYLKQFSEPFNRMDISEKCAVKRGITQEEILQEWDDAATMGTFVHQIFEDYADCIEPIVDHQKYPKGEVAQKFIKENFDTGLLVPVEVEMIVHDFGLNIAGQLDILVEDEEANLWIYDWKTNEEIKRSNWYNKMKAPFSHLDDCHYNKYTLQMNTYRQLLEKMGVKIAGMRLVHIGYWDYEVMELPKVDVI